MAATPARHGPVGIEPISGDVIGFVLQIGAGPAIYISGDTVWYEQIAEIGRRFEVRLAILFTGSAEPRGPFHVTMDSNDAIEAAYAFPNAKVMAVHNEGWAHFTQTQEDLAKAVYNVGTGRTPRIAAARRSGVSYALRCGLAFRGTYGEALKQVDTVDRSGQKWTGWTLRSAF